MPDTPPIQPATLTEWLRVHAKRLEASIRPRRNFCKKCGRDHRDFIAPDFIWGHVEPHIRYGNTLCYDCFFDAWHAVMGEPIFWSVTDTAHPIVKDVYDGEAFHTGWRREGDDE